MIKIKLNNGEKAFIKRKYKDLIEDEKLSSNYIDIYEKEYGEDLGIVLSSFHNWVNNTFNYMNKQISSRYFHSPNSQDTIYMFRTIDTFLSNLYKHKLKLNDYYRGIKLEINKFIKQSGGTTVPDEFNSINIIEVEPIFYNEAQIQKNSNSKLILKPIGEGSYAEVFKYHDEDYNNLFALKRAKKNLDTKNLERFKREFEVMKSLSSPYIVNVYKYNEDTNEYTMEYLDYTLRKYLMKYNQTLSSNERFFLVTQIIRAFKFVEKKEILHRDISSSNILIKEYEHTTIIKISDFGLTKIKGSTLTSGDSEFRGSLNDPGLEVVGFRNYEIRHETYALTRLIATVLSGKFNISKIKNENIIKFLNKGISSNLIERYQNITELETAVNKLRKVL